MRELNQFLKVRNKVWLSIILMSIVSCSQIAPSGFLSQFSTDSARYVGHSWSPDGRWLASESTELDQITLFSADGQLVNELHTGCVLGGGVEEYSWTPDGRISCFIGNEPPQLQISKLNQQGQVSKSMTIGVPINSGTLILAFQWNPHHFWLATLIRVASGESERALYISDLQGHNLIAPMTIAANLLAWSQDGSMLALVEQNGDVLILRVQQDANGKITLTKIQQLAAGTASEENVEWSPSDHWLVCHHGSYDSEDYLFLLAADGSGKRVKLTSSTTDGQLGYPSWSPDGKQLIVTRASDGALLSLDIAALLKAKGVTP